MGTVTFYKQADMSNPGVWYGYVTTANSSQISITDYAGRSGTYYGSFTYTYKGPYLGYVVSGGKLSGYTQYTDYGLAAVASGFNISAAKAYKLIQVDGNARGLYELALSGNDTIYGSNYADVLLGYNGNDFISAGSGDDSVSGGAGNDTINGGDGSDSISGDAGNDTINGDAGTDYLAGGAGNDVISGGDGVDYITGDAGNDTINGDAGDDFLTGGVGNDLIRGGDGADNISGDAGNDTLYGDAGDDVIIGGLGNDLIYGGIGDDTLVGAEGNDTLYGDAGNDFLAGDAGNDVLYGGAGNDYLFGDLGKDTLYGGDGSDVFGFDKALSAANVDTIKDFAIGTDKIALDHTIFSAFAEGVAVSSDQFSVVSSVANLKGNGFLTYCTANDTLYYDSNGLGTGDLAVCKIELTGASAPTAADFVVI